MAERVTNFDFGARGNGGYPHDEWCDGAVWRLDHGEDFTASIAVMRANLSVAGKKRGGRFRTRVVNDGASLMIQFYKEVTVTPPADTESTTPSPQRSPE